MSVAASFIAHIAISTNDSAATCRFYLEVFGLKEGYRPKFTTKGAWLYKENQDVLHIIEVDIKEPIRAAGYVGLHHVALHVESIEAVEAQLKRLRISYRKLHDCRGTAVSSILLEDPNGITLEVIASPKRTEAATLS